MKEKLAKALEFVAESNLERLRHHVSTLAEHLDDDNDLVRYHLVTALTAIGCADPERLVPVSTDLENRVGDENEYVHGRAVEALGVLLQEVLLCDEFILGDLSEGLGSEASDFLLDRVTFTTSKGELTDESKGMMTQLGQLMGFEKTTTDVANTIVSPAVDSE